MVEHFTCYVCGREHEGPITDWGYTLPDVVWEIPEEERADSARFTNDLCQFEDRYFIRCILYVPFTERSGQFGWGGWAEVDWDTFERYLAIYDEDGSAEPTRNGRLANELPGYPGSLNTKVQIRFRDAANRPALHVQYSDESRLSEEQRQGIDDERYFEILHLISPA